MVTLQYDNDMQKHWPSSHQRWRQPASTKGENAIWAISSNTEITNNHLHTWQRRGCAARVQHLLEDIEVDANGSVEEYGRQEDIQKDICRFHAQEEGKGVPKPSQVDRKCNPLAEATCSNTSWGQVQSRIIMHTSNVLPGFCIQ